MSDDSRERLPQPDATLAVVALLCGILGVLGNLATPVVGVVLGAFGVTTGMRGRHVRPRFAITGIVLGVVAVVLGVVLIIIGPVAPAP